MQKAKGISLSGSPSVSQRANSLAMMEGEGADSDLDLDFDAETLDIRELPLSSPANEGANTTSLAMLQQPLHRAVLQYGKQHSSAVPSSNQSPLLTTPHGALSRVFVNTLGRLGRWRRVLNSRSPGRIPLSAYVDVSAFDVEASETGDLLTVKGGVEQYLKTVENQIAQASLTIHHQHDSLCHATSNVPSRPSDDQVLMRLADNASPPVPHDDRTPTSLEAHTPTLDQDAFRSTTTLIYRNSQALSEASCVETDTVTMSNRKLEVVSIDDMDFSDLSDEQFSPPSPPGLKRAHRKLPTRRDFEFVRHSAGSVSSMGIQTRESLMSGDSSSAVSSVSATNSGELAGGIQQWQMNALVESLSDDEENGDVEDALKRLEGQISQDKQREKQSKVDRWIQSIQERATAARLGLPSPHDSHDSSDEDYGEVYEKTQQSSAGDLDSRDSVSVNSIPEKSSQSSIISVVAIPSTCEEAIPAPPTQSILSDAPPQDMKSSIEEVVPLEILQSRMTNDDSARVIPPPTMSPKVLNFPLSNKSPPSKQWKSHQSFVLNYRSETLIQHFSMIDRELFLNIRFEESLIHHSCIVTDVADILDWGQFLRERARLKAEGRAHHKTDSLTVVRSRFNLVARFVLSEVVLTHPSQRAMIFGKFIRMAWVRSFLDFFVHTLTLHFQ